MKISNIFFAVVFPVVFFALPAYAITPSLSVFATGTGDNVQITVNAEANTNAILHYTQTGSGLSAQSIGTTNSSGQLLITISAAQYNVVAGTNVYVTMGGLSGAQSNQVPWPYISSASTSTLLVSQSAVVLPVGQSSTITATNAGSTNLYVLNNSNPGIANINVTSNQAVILGNTAGSTTVTLCTVGSTSNCASIFIMVEPSGSGFLSFNQTTVSVGQNQNVPITISGGTGVYSIVNNSNVNVISASISNSIVTFSTTKTSGSATVVICSTNNSSCGVITVTASSAVSTSTVTFSQTSPILSVGQSATITIYGNSGTYFYVSNNSNPNVAQANISGNVLTLVGGAAGSSTISVCASGGSCSTLTATVNANSGNGLIALSQSTINLAVSQTLTVTITSGLSPYTIYTATGSSTIVTATLNSNIISLYGIGAGTTSVDVCPALGGGGCTSLKVIVGGATSSGQTTLSQNSVSLTVGQPTTITITGGSSYYMASNSNPAVASVLMSGSSAIVSPVSVGTSTVSICQSAGQCATLFITVNQSAPVTVVPAPISVPTPTTPSVFTRYLKYGDTGADVLALQKLLVKQGFLTVTPTGRYGPATVIAMKKLQKKHGIKQVGNMGPATKEIVNQLAK